MCGMITEILDPKISDLLMVTHQLLIAIACSGNITCPIFGKSDLVDDFKGLETANHSASERFSTVSSIGDLMEFVVVVPYQLTGL